MNIQRFNPQAAVLSWLLILLCPVPNVPGATDLWSLNPLERPPVPTSTSANPIDAFVQAELRKKKLAPSPQADRRTLIRRLYFDLVGLPPRPGEVEAFVADSDAAAYPKLVDRLLASPHYGERWARHWLDVTHYADTHGYDKDQPRPNAWPYRDYVIRSLNADKPYGRFVEEQLAGDALYPESPEAIDALGFIAAGPWDLIGHKELSEEKTDGKIARHLDRDDMVMTTMSVFTSMTVHCAQCHDHKFDPIPSADYYNLQSVFAALDRADKEYYDDPHLTERRDLLKLEIAQRRKARRDLEQQIAAAGGEELRAARKQLEEARKASKGEVAETEGRVAAIYEKLVPLQVRQEFQALTNSLAESESKLAAMPPPKKVFAGTIHFGDGPFRGTGPDGGKPRFIAALARGDIKRPREPAAPGALSCVSNLPARFTLAPDAPESARRAALAKWITHPDNPLTWRSIVNRVWQYHFGSGLVATPNDFGAMGKPPTHAELLDWLAVEFRDNGQSLKRLHKLIVTSSAYQQVSGTVPAQEQAAQMDAENSLLWRMNRRKLEAEAIRDSALFVSGALDLAMFGPGFQDFVIEKPEHSPHYQYHLHDPEDPRARRRSVYRFTVRSQREPFMSALDCADPSLLVDKRNQSISPPQALALLNNGIMIVAARSFAESLATEAPALERQIEAAFERALARPPNTREIRAMAAYGREHGLANACRVILNLNEFMFVD